MEHSRFIVKQWECEDVKAASCFAFSIKFSKAHPFFMNVSIGKER